MKGNKEHTSFLLLGGNLGDTIDFFDRSIARMEQAGLIIEKRSSIYKSEPWQMDDAPWFMNQVVKVNVDHSPEQLLSMLLITEHDLGRERINEGTEGYQSRIIDLDILYFDDIVLETKSLTIPHPRLHLRRFVLLPMTEIAPNWIHPVFNATQLELLEQCEDEGITLRNA